MKNKEVSMYIERSLHGDMEAMEIVLRDVQDEVFNLSLRMLGMLADAQDATQDILIKVMTNLSTYRKEADFHTWVYRIAANYLMDYRKSMFAQHPLDFDYYGNDIANTLWQQNDDHITQKEREELAEELKMSCTNVMLQCFDARTRCIYILGTMFHVNSSIAAQILDMTPENYRKTLSRAKQKMSTFLQKYCGLCGGMCDCKKRVEYAISQHRIDPERPAFRALRVLDKQILDEYRETMEMIDEQADVFEQMPHYYATVDAKTFIEKLLNSKEMKKMKGYECYE